MEFPLDEFDFADLGGGLGASYEGLGGSYDALGAGVPPVSSPQFQFSPAKTSPPTPPSAKRTRHPPHGAVTVPENPAHLLPSYGETYNRVHEATGRGPWIPSLYDHDLAGTIAEMTRDPTYRPPGAQPIEHAINDVGAAYVGAMNNVRRLYEAYESYFFALEGMRVDAGQAELLATDPLTPKAERTLMMFDRYLNDLHKERVRANYGSPDPSRNVNTNTTMRWVAVVFTQNYAPAAGYPRNLHAMFDVKNNGKQVPRPMFALSKIAEMGMELAAVGVYVLVAPSFGSPDIDVIPYRFDPRMHMVDEMLPRRNPRHYNEDFIMTPEQRGEADSRSTRTTDGIAAALLRAHELLVSENRG